MPSAIEQSSRPIRWGMIGCGAVTEVKSGPAFRLARGSRLAAVASRNAGSAADYARRHGVPLVFDTVDSLIACRDLDAIYIATPPSSHCELALKVARAGKACCVEKPMALDHDECLAMVDAFAAQGLPLFVAYYRRSLPRFLQVKAWLQEGVIGAVREVRWQLLRPPATVTPGRPANWRSDPDIAPGGYFADLACHGLNLFEFLLGDISAARGVIQRQAGRSLAEANVSASWEFCSGAAGIGSWHFSANRRHDEVHVIGTKGAMTFSVFDEAPLRRQVAGEDDSVFIENPPNIQLHHVEAMVRHIRTGDAHPSTGAEAAKTNQVLSWILAGR